MKKLILLLTLMIGFYIGYGQATDSLSIRTKAQVSKTNYDDSTMIGKPQIYAQENIFEINQELNYVLLGNKRHTIVDIVPTDTLGYEYSINYKKKFLSPTEYETGTYYYNATTKTLLRIHYTGFYELYDHYKYVATEELKKKREMIIID